MNIKWESQKERERNGNIKHIERNNIENFPKERKKLILQVHKTNRKLGYLKIAKRHPP